MSTVIHSHVQISKLLMKPFSHKTTEGRQVYYLNFSDCAVHEGKINILGTKQEYYYPSTEDFLAKEVESNVGGIFKLLKEISKEKKTFTMSVEEAKSIRTLFSYSLLRSDLLKSETIKRGVFLQFLPEKDQTQLILSFARPALDLFQDTFPNIIINESPTNFVIPHNCIYSVDTVINNIIDEFQFMCMPISPRCCVILIPNRHRERYLSNGIISSLLVSDEKVVQSFNDRALSSENTSGRNFIIGDKAELERLSIILKKLSRTIST
jgi:hypothetical protein